MLGERWHLAKSSANDEALELGAIVLTTNINWQEPIPFRNILRVHLLKPLRPTRLPDTVARCPAKPKSGCRSLVRIAPIDRGDHHESTA